MSRPDRSGGDDRRLTLIVLPHDELESRTFVIPYRRLQVIAIVGLVVLLAVTILLASLFPIMAQAARAGRLQQELESMEQQRAEYVELARRLEQAEAEYERVRQLLGADAGPGATPLLPSLRGDTSGAQTDPRSLVDLWPLTTAGHLTRSTADDPSHPGIDIAVPRNSIVRAAGAGTVRFAGTDETYGNHIIIDHGHGLETVYGHASRLFAEQGEAVRRGAIIAHSGSSGRSTAAHLHFEVRLNGRPVDPFQYVRQP